MPDLAKIDVEKKAFFVDKRKILVDIYYQDDPSQIECNSALIGVRKINPTSGIRLTPTDYKAYVWGFECNDSSYLATGKMDSELFTRATMLNEIASYKKLYLLKKIGLKVEVEKGTWPVFKLKEIWTIELLKE